MTNRIRIEGDHAYYAIWYNVPVYVLHSEEELVPFVEQDLRTVGIDPNSVKDYIWLFDLCPEGISSQDISVMKKFFNDRGVPDKNFRVAFSCAEDVDKLSYPAVCLPDRLIYIGNWFSHMEHYHIDWPNVPMTHKLVCLMRRPSIGRGNLAQRLLKKFNKDDIIMTLGTNGSRPDDTIKALVWPHPYPIIVDRPMADHVFQHRIDHDFFYRAPVNLVVESSSQIDPNTWRSKFITEKTFKALAWYQFPIWYAVPGLVAEIRKLGFDMFDDLFDNHSYDNIEDPWVRMTQVVLLTKRVCDQDTVALRKQLWSRLENNANLVKKIHTEALSRHLEALDKLKNVV